MAKKKVNFVSNSSDIAKATVKTIYYNTKGEECSDEKYVLAHVISTNGIVSKETYRCLTVNGVLYDCSSVRFPKDGQYRPITRACFIKYLDYLESGGYSDYEKAVREQRRSE